MASSANLAAKESQALYILSLDGGGVRGLTTLYILRRLMYLIRPNDDNYKLPRPCDIFDVIAGTSTGGLIAILLGRLKLDVQTCIDIYKSLAQEVFTPRKRTLLGGRFIHSVIGSPAFSGAKLEMKFQEVLTSRDPPLPRDLPLLSQDINRCKVFVCATMQNSRPLRLRSYGVNNEESIKCTIVEAARATSAAPTFFEPVKLDVGVTLRDGGLLNNNPLEELISEVSTKREFSEKHIACIVSLGTGIMKPKIQGDRLAAVAQSCVDIATNTETTHKKFKERECGIGARFRDKYYRFNVAQGVQNVTLEEWQAMEDMWVLTYEYLTTIEEELVSCVAHLKTSFQKISQLDTENKPPTHLHPDQLSNISKSRGNSPSNSRENSNERLPNIPRQISRISLDGSGAWGDEVLITDLNFLALYPVIYFSPRKELEEVINIFQNQRGTPTTVCCTVGIGGAGKTQMALRYAHDRYRKTYSAVFWIDASDHERLTSSFLRIARILGLAEPIKFLSDSDRKTIAKRWESDYVVAVKEWLVKRHGPWLLVFDNADDLAVINTLQRYFPMSEQGHILVTSRREEAYKLATNVVTVEGLLPQVAATLLLHHAGIENPSSEQYDQAKLIANQLGCLALAVDLAGGFIKKFHGDLDNYLKLYLQSKETVLKKSMGAISNASGSSYPWSVFAAWGISIASMRTVTGQFISLLSFLDRTNITLDLFHRCCQTRSRWTLEGELEKISPAKGGVPQWILDNFAANGEWDEIAFLETLDELCSYSFAKIEVISGPVMYPYEDSIVYEISTQKPRKLITLHPLLHEVARLWLSDEEQRKYAHDAECLVWHSIDDDVTKAMRSEDSDYFPIFNLGGGATSSAVSLALKLDEAYRHMNQFALQQLVKHSLDNSRFDNSLQTFSAGFPEVGRLPSLYFCFIMVFLLRTHNVNCMSKLLGYRINWNFLTEEIRRLELLRRKDLNMQWLRLGSRLKSSALYQSDPVDNAISGAAIQETYLFRIKMQRDALERDGKPFTNLEIQHVETDWGLLKGSAILENVLRGFQSLGIPLPLV